MSFFLWLVAATYGLAALTISLYAVAQAGLLRRALNQPAALPPSGGARDASPWVTVQLPLYNERAVVERLLRAVAQLDWPRDRLEVQVLDDSTDDTSDIVERVVRELAEDGLHIVHIQRTNRTGFKAGALAHGLTTARGEFVAIFDADFLPGPEFLRVAIGHFTPEIALVQGRWSWLNAEASWLTRVQTMHLDAHFTIEQHARASTSLFMGFNGTAGVWRRAAIDDAGGWHADTLTEDLDLAFRAKLCGWQLTYVDDLHAPSELPEHFGAVRTQQHRWMKGGAQVGRKLLRDVMMADTSRAARLYAAAHLMGSSVFLAVMMLCFASPLLAPLHAAYPREVNILIGPSTLVLDLCLVVFGCLYLVTSIRRASTLGEGIRRFVFDFPLFMVMSIGMCFHNGRAALEGWRGQQSAFVRTPKKGFSRTLTYSAGAASHPGGLELVVGAYNVCGGVLAGWLGYIVGATFLVLQGAGLLAVGWMSRPRA